MSKEIRYKISSEFDGKGVSDAKKGLFSLRGIASGVFGGLAKVASSAFRVLRMGAIAAFGALNGFGVWSVKTASDAEEMESKFDAVFKNLAAGAREWSKQFASGVKRSEYDVREWMSTIQDTLVPMGMLRDKAAETSKDIVKLAVDLGSFNNLPTEDVIRDIQSALVGNHETMRKYGVVISETTLKAAGMASGLADAKGEMSEQAKVLARLQIIQNGTTDAQGDAIRTAGSFANRIQGLKAAFKSLRVEVGRQIIDGADLGGVLDGLTQKVGAFLKSIQESGIIEQWAKKAKDVLETISLIAKAGIEDKDARSQIFESMGKLIWLYIQKGALSFVSILGKAMPILGKILGEAAMAVLEKTWLVKGAKWTKEGVENTGEFIKAIVQGKGVQGGVDAVVATEKARGNKPSNGFDDMIAGIGSSIEKELSALKSIADVQRAKEPVEVGPTLRLSDLERQRSEAMGPAEESTKGKSQFGRWRSGSRWADSTWKSDGRIGHGFDHNRIAGKTRNGKPVLVDDNANIVDDQGNAVMSGLSWNGMQGDMTATGKDRWGLGGRRWSGGDNMSYAGQINRSSTAIGDVFSRMYGQAGRANKAEDIAKKQLGVLEQIAKNTKDNGAGLQ